MKILESLDSLRTKIINLKNRTVEYTLRATKEQGDTYYSNRNSVADSKPQICRLIFLFALTKFQFTQIHAEQKTVHEALQSQIGIGKSVVDSKSRTTNYCWHTKIGCRLEVANLLIILFPPCSVCASENCTDLKKCTSPNRIPTMTSCN